MGPDHMQIVYQAGSGLQIRENQADERLEREYVTK
jgi:hypothetical protein